MLSAEMVEIMGPALVAGLMVAFTHAPLGIEVLKRGIVFIDLAVAQMAGLGLVVAGLYLPMAEWAAPAIALGAALLAGLFFRWVENNAPRQQEAIIGSSYILAASVALLLLADHPHGGEEVQHLLSGQILYVTWFDVLKHAPVYIIVPALWFILPKVRRGLGFYLLFAIAITSSVQLVGVYVVFASLILPALAATRAARPHVAAWACGIIAVLTGITASTAFDLTAGPVIVIAYSIVAVTMAVRMRGVRSKA